MSNDRKYTPGAMLGRPVRTLLVELPAHGLDLLVELVLIENSVQPVIKRVAGSLNHIAGCDPQILLPFSLLPRTHRHETILWQNVRDEKDFFVTFTTGC